MVYFGATQWCRTTSLPSQSTSGTWTLPGGVTKGDPEWTTGSWLASKPNGDSMPTGKGQVRRRWKWCERRRKRGKRADVRARLRANPSWPALPAILLSNVRSLENKLDYIRLQLTTQRDTRDCCVYVYTETGLNDWVPDAAIQLDWLALHRADGDPKLCDKTRGGGLCVYIHADWCNNSVQVSKSCSSLMEYIVVRCGPFHLLRELSSLHIVAVYISPSANAKEALAALCGAINDLKNKHRKGQIIVAIDFN